MKKEIEQDLPLLDALEQLYPDSSKRTLRTWIKVGKVTVDGIVATRANDIVKAGQELVVGKATPGSVHGLKILYEDPHLVIVDKPMGLLSVPLDREGAPNALKILREHYHTNSIFAVHRIDRKTSGVLAFAKGDEMRAGMDKLFKDHDLTREYLAIVEGNVFPEKGTWHSRLVERSPFEVVATTDPEKGRDAITHYEVVRNSPHVSFLKLTLETGRKHQIRVHCKEAGHPIVGDKRYGSTINPYKRLCLHAHRLAFIHPITGKPIDVSSKTPKSFES